MLPFDYIFEIGIPGYVLVASAFVCIVVNRKGISTKPLFWLPLLIGLSISGFLRHLSFLQSRTIGLDMDVVALATVAQADLIVSFSAILTILSLVFSKTDKRIAEHVVSGNGE